MDLTVEVGKVGLTKRAKQPDLPWRQVPRPGADVEAFDIRLLRKARDRIEPFALPSGKHAREHSHRLPTVPPDPPIPMKQSPIHAIVDDCVLPFGIARVAEHVSAIR